MWHYPEYSVGPLRCTRCFDSFMYTSRRHIRLGCKDNTLPRNDRTNRNELFPSQRLWRYVLLICSEIYCHLYIYSIAPRTYRLRCASFESTMVLLISNPKYVALAPLELTLVCMWYTRSISTCFGFGAYLTFKVIFHKALTFF